MKKMNFCDILTVICLMLAISFINFDKEAIKAFVTGGVIIWWTIRRLSA